MKVLIADDDKVFEASLRYVFKKRGWTVVSAYDTAQALMFAKQKPPPDVILLDLQMPGGTGLMALERLKASSLTAGIPVIVVTATEDKDAAERVRKAGAAGFVHKPVDATELAGRLEKFLGAG